MTTQFLPVPAFGHADLSNCEREQIHLAGSVQPHGALLLFHPDNGTVIQASANAQTFLGLPYDVIGCTLGQLGGDLEKTLSPLLTGPLPTNPLVLHGRAGFPAQDFDILLNNPADGGLVVELEPSNPSAGLAPQVEKALRTIVNAPSLRELSEETATIFKSLTGYDRVMVYRFDEEGHGEVFSERREPELEPYLGNRYPASDIPQIARRLYERVRVRVLVDVAYEPVPLLPRLCPLTGRDLDMSLCFLRSMSPIHIQYLKNMGVGATLVASLVVGGKLWGLVACHHYVPRNMSFESRAACDLLAEAIGTRIAALEGFAQAQAEISVRRLEQRMVEAIAQDGDWRAALFKNAQALLQPVGATGAALLIEGQVFTEGDVPGTQELRTIVDWLDLQARDAVIVVSSLVQDEPRFAALGAVAGGLLACPVSNSPGEYLIWFRPERIRMVTWGGDPLEPVIIGDDPSDLSPRRSFAKWYQLVEGRCEPWSQADIAAARMIGDTVTDVAVQFSSVRMLIAQDQLASVTQQVQVAESPIVIADARGRILLSNPSFERLIRPGHPHLSSVIDLAPLFGDSEEARRRLRDLVDFRRMWRGEMQIKVEGNKNQLVLVRADPVFTPPDRVLGFVLLFTDISERKAAEAAARSFQERGVERPPLPKMKLDSQHEVIYQKIYSSIVENAQLATLELTDGGDKTRIVQMLESIRASVNRAGQMIEHLIRHMTKTTRD